MRYAPGTRQIRSTAKDSWYIPLASLTAGTQEIGNISSERFRNRPESFEAWAEHRIIFEAPDRVRGDAHPLGESFLRELQLEAQPPKL